MQKQAPTLGRVLVMAIFALSCFSLLLYLWSAFGGPVPLSPHGYRFTASFDEATQLAQEADVRISGVSVGKVRKIELGDDGRSKATIELEEPFAPLPSDSQAILRQKTLLGETYVELSPGTRDSKPLPEDGRLATKNVQPTVELDEIFRSFDEPTREAFATWQQQQGLGVRAYGADINDAFGTLPDFAQTSNQLLKVLNSQERAVSSFIRDTGIVFDALSERDDQLAQWIVNSNKVFSVTAARNEELAATFRAFPRFIDESNRTLTDLAAFSKNATPVLADLRPVGTQLSRLLVNTNKFSSNFKGLFVGLNRLQRVARKGIPASIRFLNDARPLLADLDPFLRNINPFFQYIGLYKHELTGFFANFASAAQAKGNSTPTTSSPNNEHYLRLIPPLIPEALSIYPQRLGSNRSNAYTLPGAYGNLATGIESFKTNLCGVGGFPDLGPADDSKGFSEDLRNRVLRFFLNNGTTVAAPCKQQGKFNLGNGRSTDYPQVTQNPKPANPYDILTP